MPQGAQIGNILQRMRGLRHQHFLRRIGLATCGIVFLTGLQFVQSGTAESARAQVSSSDSLHPVTLSDVVSEEAREGEYRLAHGILSHGAFAGPLLLVILSLLWRQQSASQGVTFSLYASRAPPTT